MVRQPPRHLAATPTLGRWIPISRLNAGTSAARTRREAPAFPLVRRLIRLIMLRRSRRRGASYNGVIDLRGIKVMKHECRITVLETKCFPEYQELYLANPKSGPCPFFKKGDTFLLKRTP